MRNHKKLLRPGIDMNCLHECIYVVIRTLIFIHSGYFYSTSISELLLRGTPDTELVLCRSFTPMCHRQLRVKELPKIPMWRPERDLNPQPFEQKGDKSTNEPPLLLLLILLLLILLPLLLL